MKTERPKTIDTNCNQCASGGRAKSESELNDRLSVEIDELREIGNITVELVRLRQNECKHLCVENVAPGIFHALLSRLAAFKRGQIVWDGQLPPLEPGA